MSSIMRDASSLLLYFILNFILISRVIIVESIAPLIYSSPLENGTNIPEEYKDLPVVAKCCLPDQILSLDQEKGLICVSLTSQELPFNPLFFKSNASGVWTPGEEKDSFFAFIGYPCSYGSFGLHPINDSLYLLFNGSVYYPSYVPSMLMPGKDYCMEYIAELGLRTRVCFSEDVKVIGASLGKLVNIFALLISAIFLILTILVYNVTSKLRDVYGRVVSHYCGCLTTAFIILAILQIDGVHWSRYTCMIISYIVQFFFLASYTWLNVLCIITNNLIRTYVNHARLLRKTTKAFFLYYSLCAWGSPTILIIADICLNLNPMRFTTESDSCWTDSNIKSTSLYFFPVLICLVNNLIVFVFTGITIRRFKSDLKFRLITRNQESDRRDQKMLCILNISFMAPLVLFFFMTLTWALEFISWGKGINSFNWYAIDLVNAVHGFSVFVVFVLRRPIRDIVWARMHHLRNSERVIVNDPFILDPLTSAN